MRKAGGEIEDTVGPDTTHAICCKPDAPAELVAEKLACCPPGRCVYDAASTKRAPRSLQVIVSFRSRTVCSGVCHTISFI